MKQLKHYFPFFIIALLLYGYLFYFDEKTTNIPLIVNSGQQTVQLKFIEDSSLNLQQEATISPAENKQKQVKSIAAKIESKHTPQKNLINVQQHSKIKVAKSIKAKQKTQTNEMIDDATLKAELFTAAINADLARYKPQKKSPITKHKQTALKQMKKSKRVLKKQPATHPSETTGALQDAIVVSGNTPTYPKRAILRNQQGRVVVKLTVTTQGHAENSQIINSSNHILLDEAVLDFVQKERFMPAHKGDEKIAAEQVFSFRFELN